jgi:hypothetical protein
MLYELAWAREGEAGEPFVMGLIDVAALKQAGKQAGNEWSYDDRGAGLEGQVAGAARGDSGPVAAGWRGVEHTPIASPTRPFDDPDPAPPEMTPPKAVNGAGSYPYMQAPAVAGRA